MAKKVQFDFVANANQVIAQLKNTNAQLLLINTNLRTMHTSGTKGAAQHGSALKGLALKFVGYNLILNQVMSAQQKVVDYVKEAIIKYREFETRIAEVSTIMGRDFLDSINCTDL